MEQRKITSFFTSLRSETGSLFSGLTPAPPPASTLFYSQNDKPTPFIDKTASWIFNPSTVSEKHHSDVDDEEGQEEVLPDPQKSIKSSRANSMIRYLKLAKSPERKLQPPQKKVKTGEVGGSFVKQAKLTKFLAQPQPTVFTKV